jgi:adenylate cyclase
MRNVIASIQLGGQERRVTVLCTDLKGFGRRSRDWRPARVMEFLNRCFARLGEAVEKRQGQLDKFMGDAMVVHFNTTRRQPDHALLAVQCAREMQRLWRAWGEPEAEGIGVGVGIATGVVAYGNLGTETYNELTVVGGAMNEAALLSGQAQGGEILISEGTKDDLGGQVPVEQREGWWRVAT